MILYHAIQKLSVGALHAISALPFLMLLILDGTRMKDRPFAVHVRGEFGFLNYTFVKITSSSIQSLANCPGEIQRFDSIQNFATAVAKCFRSLVGVEIPWIWVRPSFCFVWNTELELTFPISSGISPGCFLILSMWHGVPRHLAFHCNGTISKQRISRPNFGTNSGDLASRYLWWWSTTIQRASRTRWWLASGPGTTSVLCTTLRTLPLWGTQWEGRFLQEAAYWYFHGITHRWVVPLYSTTCVCCGWKKIERTSFCEGQENIREPRVGWSRGVYSNALFDHLELLSHLGDFPFCGTTGDDWAEFNPLTLGPEEPGTRICAQPKGHSGSPIKWWMNLPSSLTWWLPGMSNITLQNFRVEHPFYSSTHALKYQYQSCLRLARISMKKWIREVSPRLEDDERGHLGFSLMF